MLRSNEYDVLEGPNGSLVLCIAVPGFSKTDLECSMEGENLHIRSITEPVAIKYLRHGIRTDIDELIYIGHDRKVDMITLELGILEILISSIIPVPGNGRISIQ